MPPWRGAVCPVAAAVAGCLLLDGCGSPQQQTLARDPAQSGSATPGPATATPPFEVDGPVDPDTVAVLQGFLQAGVSRALPPGTAVAAVCAAVPAPRAPVHCTVSMGGTAVDYLVSAVTGPMVTASPTVGLVRLDQMRAGVMAKFAPDFPSPVIDCGPGVVLVVKQDEEVTCTITSGSRRGMAHVVILDRAGAFAVTA